MSDDAASTIRRAEQAAEALLLGRLCGRVQQLRVLIRPEGAVLQGDAGSYYGKQMAQHLAFKLLGLSVLANEIDVRSLSSPSSKDGEGPL